MHGMLEHAHPMHAHVYGWTTRCLPLDEEQMEKVEWGLPKPKVRLPLSGPTFLRGSFESSEAGVDTYVALPGGSKGAAWLNGFHLGRYWNSVAHGPQRTLYVPGPLVMQGKNELVVLELHAINASRPIAELVAEPVWVKSGGSCDTSAWC